jgi:hypothetical protein
LAKLERLPKLEYLNASSTVSVAGAFPALKGSHTLAALRVNNCALNDNDIEPLATLSSLRLLDLGENLQITDAGVSELCHLPKLRGLSLTGTLVSPGCIDSLKKLPTLENLIIDLAGWSPEDQLRLTKSLPKCKIRREVDGSL